MGAGKILVIIGAILTLVSTFFLSFFAAGGSDYGSGIGFVFNIPDIMANPGDYVAGETMTVYIVAIVFIVFLISGVLQLIGLASRVFAIIGSIIVIGVGVTILLAILDVFPDMTAYRNLLVGDAIADGIWPFDLALGDVSLGTYTLLAGGALGLIGGIIGTSDF
ncbi:MAG: hypothetical protein HWN81_16340 [Candidatus Lokiarchaeota archaeon]|nr:hypothetical protein [Candidatus Lokiarchaeota archaeon]